ncbi:unnamed protein product [Vitrella brassicaformis CCMP3155]|uniref:Uncharacterized protein n=1 Tax=Vitrella brassicaformis (strain CCMP3155) TaxID=1169540 RepID=A0A0G4GU98_VITBC|nr:unnamed protein product [Vitrella brassicaformis CCMP3155]|eukprot:CEM34281.1 unnamed protein product [Vitrella brassicaformis CCMP3155]
MSPPMSPPHSPEAIDMNIDPPSPSQEGAGQDGQEAADGEQQQLMDEAEQALLGGEGQEEEPRHGFEDYRDADKGGGEAAESPDDNGGPPEMDPYNDGPDNEGSEGQEAGRDGEELGDGPHDQQHDNGDFEGGGDGSVDEDEAAPAANGRPSPPRSPPTPPPYSPGGIDMHLDPHPPHCDQDNSRQLDGPGPEEAHCDADEPDVDVDEPQAEKVDMGEEGQESRDHDAADNSGAVGQQLREDGLLDEDHQAGQDDARDNRHGRGGPDHDHEKHEDKGDEPPDAPDGLSAQGHQGGRSGPSSVACRGSRHADCLSASEQEDSEGQADDQRPKSRSAKPSRTQPPPPAEDRREEIDHDLAAEDGRHRHADTADAGGADASRGGGGAHRMDRAGSACSREQDEDGHGPFADAMDIDLGGPAAAATPAAADKGPCVGCGQQAGHDNTLGGHERRGGSADDGIPAARDAEPQDGRPCHKRICKWIGRHIGFVVALVISCVLVGPSFGLIFFWRGAPAKPLLIMSDVSGCPAARPVVYLQRVQKAVDVCFQMTIRNTAGWKWDEECSEIRLTVKHFKVSGIKLGEQEWTSHTERQPQGLTTEIVIDKDKADGFSGSNHRPT